MKNHPGGKELMFIIFVTKEARSAQAPFNQHPASLVCGLFLHAFY